MSYFEQVMVADEGGRIAAIDDVTNSLQVINYEHHEIHGGSHYTISNVVDLSINEVFDIRITTPDTTKWAHLIFYLDSESETDWLLYEDVAITTVGSAITPRNNNRNSANTAGLAIDSILNGSVALANADTDLAGSIELEEGILGSGRNSGSDRRNNEYILKQNTIYCLRLIALAAGYVDYKINWYEHTNKTA